MGDVMTALLLALATENAELREQLASAQDMLVEDRDRRRQHARPGGGDADRAGCVAGRG